MSFHSALFLRFSIIYIALGALISAHAETATQLPAAEDFFKYSTFSKAVLSPDAKLVAVRLIDDSGRDVLAVMDILNAKTNIVAHLSNRDVGQFQWVNDTRLVYDTVINHYITFPFVNRRGLFAVNSDGTYFRRLLNEVGPISDGRPLTDNATLLPDPPGAKNSDIIYTLRDTHNGYGEVALQYLNTMSGEYYDERGPHDVGLREWLLDQNGMQRMAIAKDLKSTRIWYRDPSSDQWRKLAEYDLLHAYKDGFTPLFFGPDGTLYVRALAGKDKEAIFTYDLNANKISKKPVISLADHDFNGQIIVNDKKVLGFHYQADEDMTFWFDDNMKSVQKSVDTLLPLTANKISVAQHAQTPFILVEACSDVQPTIYLLYNTDTNKLTRLGTDHHKIQAAQMGHKEMVRYKARDGLMIPAYLTLPPGREKKNLPLVVVAHDGPWQHGATWQWDPESEFLASRGYAVLEPAFRGSTGFGNKYAWAGHNQLSHQIQTDLADGAKWAIKQGIADAKRICIAGTGTGGFSALVSLSKEPKLFKCGIERSGVTELSLSGSTKKGETPGEEIALLPLAANIRQPLLMAYKNGDADAVSKFRDAMAVSNSNVEFVNDPQYGPEKDVIHYWQQVEQFLEKNFSQLHPSKVMTSSP